MIQRKLNPRFSWALSVLDLQPWERVLEIGCGTGILAEQMLMQLTDSELIAIDQSLPMIKKAIQRNKWSVAAGKASFFHCRLADFEPGPVPFGKVIAFNVNVFWKDPVKELKTIQHCLLPDGSLYLFYQAPYDIKKTAAKPMIENLQKNNFRVEELLFKKMTPASAFCIIAYPAVYDDINRVRRSVQ